MCFLFGEPDCRGNEEQTAHLQTGLCTLVCTPRNKPRSSAPFKSRDVVRLTMQQPSLPAAGLTLSIGHLS